MYELQEAKWIAQNQVCLMMLTVICLKSVRAAAKPVGQSGTTWGWEKNSQAIKHLATCWNKLMIGKSLANIFVNSVVKDKKSKKNII